MNRALGFVLFQVASGKDQYDEERAILHANLATAAYCGLPKNSKASLESWKCGPACDAVSGMTDVRQIITQDGNDAYAFVGKLNGECVLSFRGTSNLAGWMTDLSSLALVDLTARGVSCSHEGHTCQVGKGFMDNYDSLAAHIKGNLSAIDCGPGTGTGVTVTGHSLGAAEAAIAMYDLYNQGYTIKQTYTFGQPRVGDEWFKKAFENDLGNVTYRVTHYHDPIPQLPGLSKGTGFVHTTHEVYYAEKFTPSHYTVCDGSGEDTHCEDADMSVESMVLECISKFKNCDHLTYFMPTKTTHLDGSECKDDTAVSV